MSIQFKVRPAAPEAVALIERELALPHFLASVLVARGVTSVDAARAYMEAKLSDVWRNPYDLPGMEEVVDGLERALRQQKHIVVFGDFDLDGISATAVMTRGLRALGGHVSPFIPKRMEEGYGLTSAALRRVMELAPDVLVTVDCGISCKAEVDEALAMELDVLITDHHEAGDAVPTGVPLCDPKCDPTNPSSILAGVGVALKVVQALGNRFGYPFLWRSYTDLATLGTVADLMAMKDENRALVRDGLEKMNSAPRPCIAALAAAVGMEGKPLTSTNLSFSLIPRLNAAGRMGDAQIALELLMSDSYEEASRLALELDDINDKRRQIELELSEVAKLQAQQTYRGQRALVVAGEGWHEGVKGIVASRLVGIYGVPTLLFTVEGDVARGSGRSVGEVNLFKAVEAQSDLLTKFGGHGAAVGVTLPVENLREFAKRLCAYMDELPEEQFHPMVEVDALVHLEELTLENVAKIELLAPFGQENPEPTLMARNVALDSCRAVGADRRHFSCRLTDGKASVSAIYFHCKDVDALCCTDSVIDAVFTAQIDEWRGRKNVKAMIDVLAPAQSCKALDACVDRATKEFWEVLFCAQGTEGASAEDRRGEKVASEPLRQRCSEEQEPPSAAEDCRAQWVRLAQDDPEELESQIIRAIIGDSKPHRAQREILRWLREGRSTLGIMATGRGKSLVFQVYAALLALSEHKVSVFVYPLRALMADQAYHLEDRLHRFGLTCAVLSGETPQEEREAIYRSLAEGTTDIVLTTPEFLSFHGAKIAACARIGFLVVDEAHHIGQATAGQRPAYRELGSIVHGLGDPVILAVTATAPPGVEAIIRDTLPLKESVVDEASRDNLHLDDQRNIRDRDNYLAHLVASGEKCIIYVNSREQSVTVARRLRRRVPQLAPMIGFYNAGLTRAERTQVERLFRSGVIQVLVATSAFGEGIDIPDVRHAILYHMPFSDVEFNQMSGRAGRDGKDAWIHLLYGKSDVSLNEGILSAVAPERDVLVQVYKRLRALQAECAGEFFTKSLEELSELISDGRRRVPAPVVACGLSVFAELGLIESKRIYNEGREKQMFRIVEGARKVDLTDSVLYREGMDEMSDFRAFREWAMKSDLHSLVVRITHPITPDEARSEG